MRTELALLNLKDTKKPVKWLIAFLYSTIFLLLVFCLYSEKVNQDLSNSMLRLHVVANSDNPADQDLKYKVRDAVISLMNGQMGSIRNRKDAEYYIREHIGELETVANDVIKSNGFSESAKVSIGKFPFATKRYGNMVLPAGFYDALKIEIGEAKGQNWWCVMFPPLCLPAAEENDERDVKIDAILTDSGVRLIESNPKFEVRFKIVEIYEKIKSYFTD